MHFEAEIMPLIYDYCCNKNKKTVLQFLKKYGKAELFNKNGDLTKYGKEAVFQITEGRRGMMPQGNPRFFTPCILYPQKKCIFEFLPLVSQQSLCAHHGTHMYGLINAKTVGIAPRLSAS